MSFFLFLRKIDLAQIKLKDCFYIYKRQISAFVTIVSRLTLFRLVSYLDSLHFAHALYFCVATSLTTNR
jgi:hypothetical protein